MPIRFAQARAVACLLASTGLLALAVAPAEAQFRLFPRTQPDSCPPAPCPPSAVSPWPPTAPPAPPPTSPTTPTPETTTPTPSAPTPPATPPSTPEPSFPPSIAAATGLDTVAFMKGDQPPLAALAFAPPQPGTGHNGANGPRASVIAPSARTYKVSDDESPQPRDRVFFDFNFYDNVGAAVNQRLGIGLREADIYRETFGFEKTFLDQTASVGLRLPLNTLSASSATPGLGGTNTDVGDLSVILKYVFWQDPENHSLFSGGLAVTAPTGPSHFAGSSLPTTRDVILQPFVGYLWTADHWFLQGFSGIEVPTDSRDVTLLFNSLGFGYSWTRRCAEERFLRSITPTFEVHVSDPLNHRGAFLLSDPAGSADVVDLTLATTFGLGSRANLSIGVVTPVTGPRPFDVEALVQLNWAFGARGRRDLAPAANVLGN